MLAYRYDSTFEGLLSAVFDAYMSRRFPEMLLGKDDAAPLHVTETVQVVSAKNKADRVFRGLERRLSREGMHEVLCVWLAEVEGGADLLFRYMRKLFDAPLPPPAGGSAPRPCPARQQRLPAFHVPVEKLADRDGVVRGCVNGMPGDVAAVDPRAYEASYSGPPDGCGILRRRPLCGTRRSVYREGSLEGDIADPDVLAVNRIACLVGGEAHLLLGMAHFAKTAEGIYFAAITPKYNVLSLMLHHFGDRFNAQKWILYDAGRKYGYLHDEGTYSEVTLGDDALRGRGLDASLLAPDELQFQEMWKGYTKAATIQERLNPVLQRRCMPTRYWRYMIETPAR